MDALLEQLRIAKEQLAMREREYDIAHAAEQAAAQRRDDAGKAVMVAQAAIDDATTVAA